MIKETIIFTPEAIGEMVFEDWNDKSGLFSNTRQKIDLEYGNLYYLALAITEVDSSISGVDYLNEIERMESVVKEQGEYNLIGGLSTKNRSQFKDELIFCNFGAVYLQMKDRDLEDYILKMFKDMIPNKYIKNKEIKIKYVVDKSKDWNYHNSNTEPQMHIYVESELESNKIKIFDSMFNI